MISSDRSLTPPFVRPHVARAEGGLRALGGTEVADLFHFWTGASGDRYVTSVFPVDRDALGAGLPDFEGFVVVAVGRCGGERIAHDVAGVERQADRRRVAAWAGTGSIDEWHVHLRGGDRARREKIVADLRAAWVGAPALVVA